MSLFSRVSLRGQGRGRGWRGGQGRGRPNVWKEGANKRIRFSVHFDANSNEFNELIRTGHLFLSGQNVPQPMVSAAAPLQPHPSILEDPPVNQNKGWNVNPNLPNSGNNGWAAAPDPNHQHANTSRRDASVNSSHSKDNAKNPCSPQPVRPLDLKGKRPLSRSPSPIIDRPHQIPLVSVQSEAPMTEKPHQTPLVFVHSEVPMAENPHEIPQVSVHTEAPMTENRHQTRLVSVHSEAPMTENPHQTRLVSVHSEAPMTEKPHQIPPVSVHSKGPMAEKPHRTRLVSVHSEAPMTEKPHQTPLVSVHSEAPMAEKPHQTRLASVHSEADSVKEEMKGRDDISHLDLFPEISSF